MSICKMTSPKGLLILVLLAVSVLSACASQTSKFDCSKGMPIFISPTGATIWAAQCGETKPQ